MKTMQRGQARKERLKLEYRKLGYACSNCHRLQKDCRKSKPKACTYAACTYPTGACKYPGGPGYKHGKYELLKMAEQEALADLQNQPKAFKASKVGCYGVLVRSLTATILTAEGADEGAQSQAQNEAQERVDAQSDQRAAWPAPVRACSQSPS
jgi:hypothetical protein